MLCTKQNVLRRFWYATMPVDKLAGGPKPFTLLGENIVSVPRRRGQARRARRPLLPSHRQALERLERGRSHHLRLPRLDLRSLGQARAHSSVCTRPAAARRTGQGLPVRHALRLCVGRARGAIAADPGPAAGARSRLPAHPPVRRPLEHGGVAHDGEFVRQRAFLLRA